MVDFKHLFELQLEECMFVDVRRTETHLAIFVVDTHVCLELVRGTLVNLTVKPIVRLWRSVLARYMRSGL